MTTKEIAKRFYELAQQGNWNAIQDEMYHENAKSIEPQQSEGLKTVTGMDAIRQKGKEWEATIEAMHSGYCNEPQVAGDYFTCVMGFDATFKGRGRMKMDEIALYKVKDGKIVSEQFFY